MIPTLSLNFQSNFYSIQFCIFQETIYIRRCVCFILQRTIGGQLGEKAQTAACKEYGLIIAEQMNMIGELKYVGDLIVAVTAINYHFRNSQ